MEALEESRFDCVVLEDGFPGIDGAECRRLLGGAGRASGRCSC